MILGAAISVSFQKETPYFGKNNGREHRTDQRTVDGDPAIPDFDDIPWMIGIIVVPFKCYIVNAEQR